MESNATGWDFRMTDRRSERPLDKVDRASYVSHSIGGGRSRIRVALRPVEWCTGILCHVEVEFG
jgi:hypothetical protein